MDQFILGAHLGLFLKLGSLISKQAQFVSKFQESDPEAEHGGTALLRSGPAAPLTPEATHKESSTSCGLCPKYHLPPSLTTSTLAKMLTGQVFFRETRRLKMEGSPLW